MTKIFATLTSKGQLTLPLAVRRAWGLKAGDKVGFEIIGPAEGRIEPVRRRSIFEGLDALTIRTNEPLTQDAIDEAIDADILDKLERASGHR